MPGFASAASAEKRFTSRPAMWRSCRPEPATSDSPPARTCWWSAHILPFGSYDECRARAADHDRALTTIPKVALPRKDPVYGRDGPLTRLWRRT
jgi:hypothetical protein